MTCRGRLSGAFAARLTVGGLVLALSGAGCAYKVRLDSFPAPAQVRLPDNRGTVATPTEVDFRWTPLNQQIVQVSAPGYRVLTVDLREHEIKFTRYITDALFRPATFRDQPRGEITFVLIPLHGPVGTWTADEVQ